MRPNYINRHIDRELEAWASSDVRKCLLLRGARQVGKSSSVRKLGEKFEFFLEITFEKDDDARNLFEKAGNLQPQELCNKLSLMKDTLIVPGKTLLFLDEIQSSLCVISSLRFFYEDYPELHVVAAGSLLEFAMEELPSFGVRRIRSLFMYPFSVSEFLSANGNNLLLDAIKNASPHYPLDDLMISLRSDFAKYKHRILMLQISTVFDCVVKQAGKKFVYSRSGQDYSRYQIKQALEMLIMAGLVIPVIHSTNTVLLAA